jgi:haloacetate dehalogenase
MESSASAGRVASAVSGPRRWRALALLCGAFFMDALPVTEHLQRLNETFVRTWWHCWVLGQTDKPAERVINLDPDAWYQTPTPARMGEGNHAGVWAAVHDPAVVPGLGEDDRPGLRAGRAHQGADHAADRQIDCPTLLLKATDDGTGIHGDPKRIWEPWAAGPLSSAAIHSGRHEAEQAPGELARALRDFLVTPRQPASQP